MGLTMREKQAVSKALAARYRVASKKEKGGILNEFTALTGYHRGYARSVLLQGGKRSGAVVFKLSRGKPRQYDAAVLSALLKVWGILDGICGKRLAPALKAVVPILERHRELTLSPEVREKLLRVSAATIDRLLAPERKKMALKGRSLTKPGTLLKHQIPIRTFSEWNENKPGFLEFDLVAHDGGDARGDFAQTLDGTDVCTGWTETEAVPNKAQLHVFAALKAIRARLPFPLLGIDSDNGGEFINVQMLRYCQQERLTFTRSRSYRKNDNCFVEQKNYSVVRKSVGYRRYDTERELRVLNALYQSLRLYTNYFLPVMKLVEKTRNGSKVKRRYDEPQTPYHRVLSAFQVATVYKEKLRELYEKLNPADLKRRIIACQRRLLAISKQKKHWTMPPLPRTVPKPSMQITFGSRRKMETLMGNKT